MVRKSKKVSLADLVLPSEYALSKPHGLAAHPKDFDWVEKNIPCQAACPAGTDIPGYLEAITKGDYQEAYRINLRDNVFPAVLGRVCTRPCEPACRHGWEGLGDPVAICFAKRSADDFLQHDVPVTLPSVFPASGKSVAIIGGGAAGLTVARELCLWGHNVTVYERHERAGGMIEQGIPEFRLPRDIVQREVQQIEIQGVKIKTRVEVDAAKLSALRSTHDAVAITTGTISPHLPDLPGIDLPHVRHGIDFLREVNNGKEPETPRHVAVIGGGFTAVDCARMARRLGADDVCMYYRRSEKEMYITETELEEFTKEGVGHNFMTTPIKFTERGVQFARTQFTGKTLENIPGSEFEVEADLVLLGTGQGTDESWLPEDRTGLFFAGDFVNGPESLIDAIGHGKQVAREIDRALMGTDRFQDVVDITSVRKATTDRTREMDTLPRENMPEISPGDRSLRAEVECGLSKDAADREASRCYLCNYKFEIDNDLCIYCDRCLKVMPVENCIVKASHLNHDDMGRITGFDASESHRDYNMLYLDQNECIRCGACVEVCPVDCITLQKVTSVTVPRAH